MTDAIIAADDTILRREFLKKSAGVVGSLAPAPPAATASQSSMTHASRPNWRPAPPDLLNSRKTPKPEAPRWESIPQTGPRIPRNRGTFSPNKIGQTWISSGRLRRGFCRSLKPPGVVTLSYFKRRIWIQR
jgi:hypothetical protein